MTGVERPAAIEDLRQLKARYFRRQRIEPDHRGGFTDPATGTNHQPALNVVPRDPERWSDALARAQAAIVGIHHGHGAGIGIIGETRARAVWAMSDQLHLPPGGRHAALIGHGRYHETCGETDRRRLATLRLTRLRVEAVPHRAGRG